MKFKITWTGGNTEICDQDEAKTVDEFTNIHFGSAWEQAQDAGVTVELVEEPTAVTAQDGDQIES